MGSEQTTLCALLWYHHDRIVNREVAGLDVSENPYLLWILETSDDSVHSRYGWKPALAKSLTNASQDRGWSTLVRQTGIH